MSYSKRYLVLICTISVAAVFIFTAASKYTESVPPAGPVPWSYGYTDHIVGLYCVSVYNTLETAYNGAHPGDEIYQGNWPSVDGPEYMYHGGIWFGIKEGITAYVFTHYRQASEMEWQPRYPCEFGCLESDDPNWDDRPPHVEQVSDFDSWTICDDSGAEEAGPIGVELERHTFSWSVPDHDDYVVHEFLLRNLSRLTLQDFYFAYPYDCDLGGSLDYQDDLVGYEGNDTTDEWTNPTQPGVEWSDPTPDGVPDEYDAVNFDPPQQRSTAYMYDSDDDPSGYIGIRVFGYIGEYPDGEFIFFSSQHSWDIESDPYSDTEKFAYMADTGVYEEIPDIPDDWRICPATGPFDELADEQEFILYIIEGCGEDIFEMRRNFDLVLADWLGPDGIPGTDDDWELFNTDIDLYYFETSSLDEGVLLSWDITDYEEGGFNIYRSLLTDRMDGERLKLSPGNITGESEAIDSGYIKVNTEPIVSLPPYSYIDSSAQLGCSYTYYLEFVPIEGDREMVGESFICYSPQPYSFSLAQSYPNPAVDSLTIEFCLPQALPATISLYDISGRLIATLLEEKLSAGAHSLAVSLSELGLGDGVYLYQLIAGGYFAARKMVVIR